MSKETRKRDLTTVVDKLIKKQKENIRNNFSTESELESVITDASSNQHIFLKALDTNNSAVYQTIESIDKVANVTDLIAKEVRINPLYIFYCFFFRIYIHFFIHIYIY